MPIFDQGYRHWEGKLAGHGWRWLVVSRRGLRGALKSRWVVVTVFLAWVPAFVLATVLVLWGLFEQKASILGPVLTMLNRALPPEINKDPHYFRPIIWTFAFSIFFWVEILFTMVLIVLVGPGLVSQDLRFNAMPLYFAKPLRRLDYFAGKLGVIGALLTLTMIGPALLAYVLGVCFSLDITVIPETARLLGAVVAYGTVVVVSAGTLILALSSLSRNSRHVGMLWIGIWWISLIAAWSLGEAIDRTWCPLVSYTRNLDRVRHALLGTSAAWDRIVELMPEAGGAYVRVIAQEPGRQGDNGMWLLIGDLHPWYWSTAVLAGLFVGSLWLLSLRVKSLDKLR